MLPTFLKDKFLELQKIQDTFTKENIDNLVFFQSSGKLYSCTTLNKHYKRILTECGLQDIRFHDLRHSFATYLISSGVTIDVVSQMLGHSKVSTTLDVYTHTDVKRQNSAIEKLNNINL